MKTYKVDVYENGGEFWYLDGKLHREDGPAVKWTCGSKFWYINDELHREDGPAIEYADGAKSWHINGKKLSKKQFNDRNKPKPTCAGKVVEIDGLKYKLVEA